jgi:hypothetical protein
MSKEENNIHGQRGSRSRSIHFSRRQNLAQNSRIGPAYYGLGEIVRQRRDVPSDRKYASLSGSRLSCR